MKSYHTRPTNPRPAWLVVVNVALGLLALSVWGWIFGLVYLAGLAP